MTPGPDAPPNDGYDVLVLGAGVAGLNAAALLSAAGQRVAVIEARARIGGRILTRHVPAGAGRPTLPIELGAEFVHGLPAETWALLREAGLDTQELDGESLQFDGVRLQPAAAQGGSSTVLHDMADWVARHSGTDATFAQYLEHTRPDPAARRAAIRYVEGFNAADHRIIGVAALAKQQRAEDAIAADRLFHVRAGYDSVPRHLREKTEAAGGAVILERPVGAIRWSAGEVTFSGADPRGDGFAFRGRRAVITLPLGVLQSGAVRFDPPPDDRLEIAAQMAMGTVIRVPMVFRSRFWRDASRLTRLPDVAGQLEQLSFLFAENALPSTWWTANPDPAASLTAWIGGPRVAELAANGAATTAGGAGAAAVEATLHTLAAMFGEAPDQLRRHLAGWYFHDWTEDPFARGAYSYMPAGALPASGRLAEPVADTLYFAGEHTTTTGHWGTVHGALQSGAAAAAAILAAGRGARGGGAALQ